MVLEVKDEKVRKEIKLLPINGLKLILEVGETLTYLHIGEDKMAAI